MRPFLIIAMLTALGGCSEVWSHRPDCIFGFRSDDCAPGTVGYQQVEQAQAQARANAANDEAKCQSFGFRPGSDSYAQCRMNLDSQRNAAAETNRAAAMQYLLNQR